MLHIPLTGYDVPLTSALCRRCLQGTLREALDSGSLATPAASAIGRSPAGPGTPGAHHWPELGLVLPLLIDVASALLHIHSEGLLHGDLKARNVMLATGSAPTPDFSSGVTLLGDPGVQRLPRQLRRQLEAAARAAAARAGGAGGVVAAPGAPSSSRRAFGLVAKLADFGLSLSLGTEATHISHIHGVRTGMG